MNYYLIVSCREINSWDCDITKDPLFIRPENNISSLYLNKGYEIYKLLPNGNLNLIKPYDKKIARKDLTGGRLL